VAIHPCPSGADFSRPFPFLKPLQIVRQHIRVGVDNAGIAAQALAVLPAMGMDPPGQRFCDNLRSTHRVEQAGHTPDLLGAQVGQGLVHVCHRHLRDAWKIEGESRRLPTRPSTQNSRTLPLFFFKTALRSPDKGLFHSGRLKFTSSRKKRKKDYL
jgi:hypothetical protein